LEPLRNLVAVLFRLENSLVIDDVKRVLPVLVSWLEAPEQTSLRRAFTVWLKRVFLPGRMPGVEFGSINDLQEVQSMLAERVTEWTTQWKHEGEASFLIQLLENRFGPLNEFNRDRILHADSETLLRWGGRIYTATTIDAVFTD
jgi:hypothetical protein